MMHEKDDNSGPSTQAITDAWRRIYQTWAGFNDPNIHREYRENNPYETPASAWLRTRGLPQAVGRYVHAVHPKELSWVEIGSAQFPSIFPTIPQIRKKYPLLPIAITLVDPGYAEPMLAAWTTEAVHKAGRPNGIDLTLCAVPFPPLPAAAQPPTVVVACNVLNYIDVRRIPQLFNGSNLVAITDGINRGGFTPLHPNRFESFEQITDIAKKYGYALIDSFTAGSTAAMVFAAGVVY